MTPEEFVGYFTGVLHQAEDIPLGNYKKMEWPPVKPNAPRVMLFSAHPDDECFVALAVRLRREGCHIVNVAMTLGRDEQSLRRASELQSACAFLDFELAVNNGKEPVRTYQVHSEEGRKQASSMILVMERYRPDIVITHHGRDFHPDHTGTNRIVRDAIGYSKWDGLLFESEYWHQLESPNVMIEVSDVDVVVMLKALSFHKGELERNPYHVRLPALLSDNVRRCEVVMGRGCTAPTFDFAAIYQGFFVKDGRPVSFESSLVVDTSTNIINALGFAR